MKGEKREIWMHLCEQAAIEQDADKLMDLIQQINQLLEEKENRLKGNLTGSNSNRDKKPDSE